MGFYPLGDIDQVPIAGDRVSVVTDFLKIYKTGALITSTSAVGEKDNVVATFDLCCQFATTCSNLSNEGGDGTCTTGGGTPATGSCNSAIGKCQ